MNQHTIGDYWTILLDHSFARYQDEDCFVHFVAPARSFMAIGYGAAEPTAANVLSRRLQHERIRESEFSFAGARLDMAGWARRGSEGNSLKAYVAMPGRFLELQFSFDQESTVEWALNIWRSVNYCPPPWVEHCLTRAEVLLPLWDALERDFRVEDAVRAAKRTGDTHLVQDALLAALTSDHEHVVNAACYGLGALRKRSPLIREALLKCLSRESVAIRARAAEALIDLGEGHDTLVGPLVEALEPPPNEVAPHGEGRILGDVCKYRWVPDRYHAARVLSYLDAGAAAPAREALLRRLGDASGCVRAMVAKALAELGEPAASLAPPLVAGLNDPAMCRWEQVDLAEMLHELMQPSDLYLPVLIRIVLAKEWASCAGAFRILRELGPAAAPAAPALVEAMATDETSVRIGAAAVLAYIPSHASDAVPVLLEALKLDNSPDGTAELIEDLAAAGAAASQASPLLRDLLEHEERVVRSTAARALWKVAADTACTVPVLTEALNETHPEYLLRSLIVIGEMGPAASSAIPRLKQLLFDTELDISRPSVLYALLCVGLPATDALVAIDELEPQDEQERDYYGKLRQVLLQSGARNRGAPGGSREVL